MITRFCIGSPSPDRYNLTSFADEITLKNDKESQQQSTVFGQKKKTFCFGSGREAFDKACVNTGNLGPDKAIPGPGTYLDKTKNIAVNAKKFSMLKRKIVLDDDEIAIKRGVPGPGHYEDQLCFNKVGNYVSSMYGNSKATRLGKEDRLPERTDPRFPGPGAYEEVG